MSGPLILAGSFGMGLYSWFGIKYRSETVYSLTNSDGFEDYKLHELQGSESKTRKIIDDSGQFIIYKLLREKNISVTDPPVYVMVGGSKHVASAYPIGGGSHVETKIIGIADGWDGYDRKTPSVYGSYTSIDSEYEKKLYLNDAQAVQDFCHDVNLAPTMYNLKPTVIVEYTTSNRVYVVSNGKQHFVDVDRNRLIQLVASHVTKKRYPFYIGAGMIGGTVLMMSSAMFLPK